MHRNVASYGGEKISSFKLYEDYSCTARIALSPSYWLFLLLRLTILWSKKMDKLTIFLCRCFDLCLRETYEIYCKGNAQTKKNRIVETIDDISQIREKYTINADSSYNVVASHMVFRADFS